jgi:hypothetical protein
VKLKAENSKEGLTAIVLPTGSLIEQFSMTRNLVSCLSI